MCVSARARLGGRLERRGCRDGENETDRQKNRGSTGVALTGQEQEKERKLEAGSEAGGGAKSEGMGATGRPCVCTCACVFPCLAASRYVSRAVKGAGTTPDCGLRDGPTSWTLAWRPPLPAPPAAPHRARKRGAGSCTAPPSAPPRRGSVPVLPTPSLDLEAGPWADGGSLAVGPTPCPADAPRESREAPARAAPPGRRWAVKPGCQEPRSRPDQAAQMRVPLCLLLLVCHAADMLPLNRRKKQGARDGGAG